LPRNTRDLDDARAPFGVNEMNRLLWQHPDLRPIPPTDSGGCDLPACDDAVDNRGNHKVRGPSQGAFSGQNFLNL
jgi:hypothetical protein